MGPTGFDSMRAETGISVLIDNEETKVINLFGKAENDHTAKLAA